MSTENDTDENFRYFVRIGQTDLDGTKNVERALIGLQGIGRRTARLIAQEAGVDRRETLGRLDDDAIDTIVDLIENYADTAPDWLANRQHDYYTGDTRHLIGNEVQLVRQQDVNRMQKIGSYKGIRHRRGQKVRGQRTKSTGRTEGTVGVSVEDLPDEDE